MQFLKENEETLKSLRLQNSLSKDYPCKKTFEDILTYCYSHDLKMGILYLIFLN